MVFLFHFFLRYRSSGFVRPWRLVGCSTCLVTEGGEPVSVSDVGKGQRWGLIHWLVCWLMDGWMDGWVWIHSFTLFNSFHSFIFFSCFICFIYPVILFIHFFICFFICFIYFMYPVILFIHFFIFFHLFHLYSFIRSFCLFRFIYSSIDWTGTVWLFYELIGSDRICDSIRF